MDGETLAAYQAAVTLIAVMIRTYGKREQVFETFAVVMSQMIEGAPDASFSGLLTTWEQRLRELLAAIPE